uniref:Calmodulin regulated spectrin-associated protein family, member 2a n=1 Tax=Poecilia formosa TaxID=48698 RepID=A0A096M2T7_POEFO
MGEVQDVRDAKKSFVAPAIKSFEHYDFSRAKICCSLRWLVSKAYGTENSIPAELKDPFYTDQYEQEHLKPPVTSLLLSADLYCRAGSLILKSDAAKPLLGHDAVIQALAQRGLYVTDQDRLVTERDLRKRPLQMGAHLAMIDTLMMAYTVETVNVEKLPVCCKSLQHKPLCKRTQLIIYLDFSNESPAVVRVAPLIVPNFASHLYQQARYRKEQASTQLAPWIPPVDNLLKDSTDGSALGALLHFYCPQLLPLDDVCLKENMSLADRLYNLQLIQDFCKDNLNSCCHFSLEDMLYASSTIKNNYLVFMAELFWWFEVVKPSFVKPRMLDNEGTEPSSILKSMPFIPISKATKRSFMERPPSPERPSLPLRPQPRNTGDIKRSSSMSFVDGNLGTWPKEKRSGPYGVSFDIPFDKGDSAPAVPSSTRGMVRSISTDEEGCPERLAGVESCRQAYPNGHGSVLASAPSMEETLQIIHNPTRQPVEGINSGFFLHSQDPGSGAGVLDPLPESDSKELLSTADTTEVDTGIHIRTEDMLDEDSSLKDLSVNMDLDVDTPSPSPSNQSKSPSGVKLTSFAEQKMRKLSPSAPDSGRGSSSSMKTTPEVMATEMVQLRIRLEEKRKAIEAQKKKVEAAFTRHRQKMGHSAFLNVVKRKADGAASGDEGGQTDGEGKLKTPGSGDEGGQSHAQITEADLSEYTRSIEKLNHSLAFLQAEMQRLAQQQEVIMAMREQQHQQTWVIPPPHTNPSPQKHPRPGAVTRSSGPSSPADSPRNPRTARPSELKLAPYSRVLTAPQSVDSIPRLRRFSPCQPVLAHPVVETFTVTPSELPPKPEPSGQAKSSLIEVPLMATKSTEDLTIDDGLEMEQDSTESADEEQMLCRGFFFKEDGKAEENMAQRRAALLEKRMRREKESQMRKMELEAELEQKKEGARYANLQLSFVKIKSQYKNKKFPEYTKLKAEEERVKKEEEKARKEFIKQEYLRRKQLKLMEDMDTIIKPRPAKQKRGRPKSIHRDSMDSPKTPVRAPTGSRQRFFSVSSLSLASLTLGDSDSVHSDKRAPSRPDSANGFLSPTRSSSRNGEKDWENASTTSSVTSNTEYTGPRLYKEPSAKSNKHIIQNALAHCCLAGKVNEGQKNKILEEMEKSEANNFLVLFRDSGCQFRSLYTYCPETQEINKLTGIGPKSITRKMIDGLYKYNSDKKQFSQIPAKTMSASVDAVTIHNHLWQTKKPATPKKVVPAQS